MVQRFFRIIAHAPITAYSHLGMRLDTADLAAHAT
tara:strand:+ start:364 stop:468 length:105 start_codon:yes stop_codon:yes gene_type:complete